MPTYAAAIVAALVSFGVALALAVPGAFGVVRLVERFEGALGEMGIVVFFAAIPEIAFPVFILAFSILVNVHRRASWKIPTAAFALCCLAIVLMHMILGFELWPLGAIWLATGAVAWLISCRLLYRRRVSGLQYVV